jgi:AcrR family transcriptional regulator
MSVPKSRRARRRTYLAAADRRAQILDVAKTVFTRRGYRVANVADICRAARIGRGTLYQYFPNKQSVLLAVMEEIAARVKHLFSRRKRVADIPGAEKSPPELVAAFAKKRLREVLDAVFVDEPTLRLLVRDARGLDGAVDQVIAMIDGLVFDAIEADVRTAQRIGVLRRGDTRLIARFILGGIEKMVLAALADDAPVDLDAIVDTAVELELFGLLHQRHTSR